MYNQKEYEQIKSENADLKTELEGFGRHFAYLQQQIEQLEYQVKLLTSEKSTLLLEEQESSRKDSKEVISLQRLINTLQSENAELNQREQESFRKDSKEVIYLQTLINTLQSENAELNQREQESSRKHSEEVISLQTLINTLQSENAELNQRCQHNNKVKQEEDNDRRRLHVQISKLESNITELNQDKETLNSRVTVLREEKSDLDEERIRYKLEADRIGTEDITNQFKIENDRLRSETNSARTDLLQMAKDIQQLKTEIKVVNDEYEQLKKNKAGLVPVFKVESEKNKDHTDRCEREIETLRVRLTDLESDVQQKDLEMKSRITKIEGQSKDIQEIQKRNERARHTVEYDRNPNDMETNPASNSQHISSDKHIYHFTASSVNFINNSTVDLKKAIDISDTIKNNVHMAIED